MIKLTRSFKNKIAPIIDQLKDNECIEIPQMEGFYIALADVNCEKTLLLSFELNNNIYGLFTEPIK